MSEAGRNVELGAIDPDDFLEEIAGLEPDAVSEPPFESPPLFDAHFLNPSEPQAQRPPALVDGLLRPGYTNLCGPWKSGKTILALSVSLHLHLGVPFLGRSTEKTPCCWLQLDMAECDFQSYADRLCRGMSLPQCPMPYFSFSGSVIDLANSGHQELLIESLQQLGTRVLFIDSSRAASSIDEDKSDEVREFVRGFLLARLRDERGISTVLLSHPPKSGGGPRGSGEWAAGADSVLQLRPSKKQGQLRIEGLGRHAPFEITLEVDIDDDSAVVREMSDEAHKDPKQQERVEVLYKAALQSDRYLTQNQAEKALSAADVGAQRGTCAKLFKEVVRQHSDLRIEERKLGRYPSTVLIRVDGTTAGTTSTAAIDGSKT